MLKRKATGATKRILLIGDLHCGSNVGLTPKKDQQTEQQEKMFNQYLLWLKSYRPFDHVFVLGDAIDGEAKKEGGVEQITTDRLKQCEMAASCISATGSKAITIIAGTGYHVGNQEDFELVLANSLGAQFTSHAFCQINGANLNFRHKIGGSSMDHLKYGALGKEIAANIAWNQQGVEPLAHVIGRAHTHKFAQVDSGTCLGFVIPALQGINSRYGARQCSGTVSFGLVVMDITSPDDISWKVCLSDGELQKVENRVIS